MNEPVYVGLSILELSKTVIYGFWCDYLKPSYGEKYTDKNMIFTKTLQKMLKPS